jgi:hypothetical protein
MSTFESTQERELLDLTERTPPAFNADELESPATPGTARPHAAPPPIPAKALARATTALPLPPPPGERPRAQQPSDDSTANLRTVRPAARRATLPPPIPARASGQHAAVPPPIPARASGQHATVASPGRAATVPPPIPAAARRATVPPPIPSRTPRPSTSPFVENPARGEEESVEVDLTPAPFPRVEVAATPSPDANAPIASEAARDSGPVERGSEVAMTTPVPKSSWDDLSASLPPLPTTRPRGTIPPLPSPAKHEFVVAPSTQSSSQMFAAPAASKTISVADLAAHDDPTPLPRPLAYGDFTNDFDRDAKVDVKARTPRAVKWAAGAALVVGIIAIAFFATRAGLDDDKPARSSTHLAATAPAHQADPASAAVPAPQAAEPAAQAVAPAAQATVDNSSQSMVPSATQAIVNGAVQGAVDSPAQPAVDTTAPAAVEAIADGIRVTSEPAGATVTLIDNGSMTELGTTPLAAKLDRARSYDLVIAHAGYDTKVARIAPNTKELAVALTTGGAGDATVTATTGVPVKAERDATSERSTKAVRTTKAESATKTESIAKAEAPSKRERSRSRRSKRSAIDELAAPKSTKRVAAAESSKGVGTLMVSSKPPCEIVIDGVATVLTTPQRAIKLPAGKHKITLFNLRYKIDKTFEVTIEPKRPTKLIKDFMTNRPPQG